MVRWATPLFLALCLVELIDLVFAVDSVPAIFAITTDPFIVYTSNIFAILGLRALYFALAAMIHRFKYLKYALALVLVFIGSKIFLVGIIGKFAARSMSLSGDLRADCRWRDRLAVEDARNCQAGGELRNSQRSIAASSSSSIRTVRVCAATTPFGSRV